MRTYPRNSPQAAARIVGLALLADNDVSRAELAQIDSLRMHEQLGLSRVELSQIVHHLCEDLLATHNNPAEPCRVDERSLAELLAEVDDPALRRKVVNLCVAVVEADAHLAEGESTLLSAAVTHWGLEREMLAPLPAGAG
jgi:uncharacterized tellurite resistance protein B-like protein